MDNLNVKIEQRVNGDLNTRPSDIYHPDFDNGKPSFFLIFLSPMYCNIAQYLPLLMLVQTLRVVKFQKLFRRRNRRWFFFRLVVETLGLWTPFAVKTLWTIATRASLYNGLHKKLIFKNLIEQLSLKLWAYNSKLVLDHFSFLLPMTNSLI